MSNRVAILGCGWLGTPLALAFIEEGYIVHGSTTSAEKIQSLENAGIRPFKLRVGETGIEGPVAEFLKNVDILVVNIPPGLRKGPGGNYVNKMKAVHREVNTASVRKMVFVSSTSVYGSAQGKVTEATKPCPDSESGRQLLECEQLFLNDPGLNTIVIRFGGLIGPERHPVTHLSGKKGLKNGNERINLIHLQDCIHLITTVINAGHWNEVFNGVYPAHPEKRKYYTSEALKRSLKPPDFSGQGEGKAVKYIISSNFLTKNYSFFTSIFG